MPRLLVINGTGQVSGAERVLVRAVAAAVDSGWEVTCAVPNGPLEEDLRTVGAATRRLPDLGLGPGPRSVAAVGMLWRWVYAALLLRQWSRQADVVLLNSLTTLPALCLSRYVPARLRPPAVWLAHDVLVCRDRLRLYRLCSPALSAVVGVSAAVADQLRGGDVRVAVIHNGVAWPVEPAPKHPPGTRVVGINALLTPWKGQHVLLDAVPLLPGSVHVEIMGGVLLKDADYAADIRRRADEAVMGGRVSVLGHVPDPLARMRTWSMAVSASTDPEACPLNVLEAMSIGVPVVATDHGGAPEVLAGGGLLVPAGDAPALAKAINSLLEEPELSARCTSTGRDRVASGHRAVVQTGMLLDLLAEEAAE